MGVGKPDVLLGEERRRKIGQLVQSEGRVTVADLVKRFGLSEVTLRSDLEALAATGAVVRVHGGAIKPEDPAFLGVAGIDPEMGLSTPDILEAQLNAVMTRVAREVTVVTDSSKFYRRSLSVIAKMELIHRVITDNQVDQAMVVSLRNRGIEVTVV